MRSARLHSFRNTAELQTGVLGSLKTIVGQGLRRECSRVEVSGDKMEIHGNPVLQAQTSVNEIELELPC